MVCAVYVGRTVNYDRRMAEHRLNPERAYLMPLPEIEVESSQAPFVEQLYIEAYGTLRTGILGSNKRNEIALNGPRRDIYNRQYKNTEVDLATLDTLTRVDGMVCRPLFR